jgi:hypothetical protein
MNSDVQIEPQRPSLMRRLLALVVLLAVAAIAIKIIIGLVMAVVWIVVGAALVVAVLWAVKTLVW